MAEVLDRRAPTTLKQNDWLVKHAFNVTSQGGEDGVIAQIFERLDEHEAAPATRWCVEFGAWDGRHLSNTWNLLHEQPDRWSGVLIEADAARVNQMREMYRAHSNVTCVNSFVELDGDNTLDRILQRHAAVPKDVDLMSIDVDGADYHIWAELTEFRPKVIIIEFNPTIPNNVVYIQARSTNIYHGSSLAALIALAKQKGYELVSTTTFNAFFVDQRFYPLFNIDDNHIDKMHDVPMPTEFFQLYDGTIKITGCKKLIWKNVPINERDIQILPPSERSFPFLPTEHDAISAAEAHATACQRDAQQDYEYFVTLARVNMDKYSAQDIRKVMQFGADVCVDEETRFRAESALWDLCEEQYRRDFASNRFEAASDWLKAMLKFRPRCSAQERASVLQMLGESLVRCRKFEDAEFYLQTALAIQPEDKATLKSLAKLYTKTQRTDLVDELVVRIKRL
ncbi:hypothetical protein PINS_up005214 [Pythium insidiosum]|nr:hypothetical protein PINS_up005214 [Pythium insidiosum]